MGWLLEESHRLPALRAALTSELGPKKRTTFLTDTTPPPPTSSAPLSRHKGARHSRQATGPAGAARTPRIDPDRSLSDQLVGVDEHQTAGIQRHRPPSGRVSEMLPAEIDAKSPHLTEILNDDASALRIGARINQHARIDRQVPAGLAAAGPDMFEHCSPPQTARCSPLPVHHRCSMAETGMSTSTKGVIAMSEAYDAITIMSGQSRRSARPATSPPGLASR